MLDREKCPPEEKITSQKKMSFFQWAEDFPDFPGNSGTWTEHNGGTGKGTSQPLSH